MIQFNQTDTSYEFILTLTELVTVNEPVYDFEFIHVLTKETVSFSKTEEDDNSNYPSRYNSFTIDTTLFEYAGEWHYTVTQRATDDTEAVLLESGKMIIDRDFSFTMYEGATSYKAYGL